MDHLRPFRLILLLLLLAPALGFRTARAQVAALLPEPAFSTATHVIVPQRRAFPLGSFGSAVKVSGVRAAVRIREQVAETTLDVDIHNPGGRQVEGIILVPVPEGAVVTGYTFEGLATEPTAELLPRDEARRTYDEIVRRIQDPALLEFAGLNLVRSSVFPIAANTTLTVRLVYENLLERDGDRIDYILPRSEALDVTVPWSVRVSIESSTPIATVYSPSHEIATERIGAGQLRIGTPPQTTVQPGSFRLSYLLESKSISASIFAYPDARIGGGYFLLMAGLPDVSNKAARQPREVTIVIDRSGSMAGEKIDQVRAAALQVIEGLEDGEKFNIIDYATTVESMAAAPVTKDRAATLNARQYLARIRPTGGTNIHGALKAALAQPHEDGMLPIVLFLTDGLPTVGETAEVAIRKVASESNPHQRRLFAFGVGADVNVPLLDRIADDCRGLATYALPGEDVELKVAQVFKRLYGPVLADVSLTTVDAAGALVTDRVREIMPFTLPDVYEDGQFIVFGQYIEETPLRFQLAGDYLGERRTFSFEFDLSGATIANAFVPRLWAARRIAYLVDQVRQAGASTGLPMAGAPTVNDPRMQELIDEIMRLSTEYGVLTEYTAFLALEGSQLGAWSDLVANCSSNLQQRAVQTRWGVGAVNQGVNFNRQKVASQVDYFNAYVDAGLNEVEITGGVQAICDRTFFQRGARWIDGRLVGDADDLEPDDVIEFGSDAHRALLGRFVREGRAGVLALAGEIVLELDGQTILIRNTPGA